MAYFYFNPFADAVKIQVKCPECGKINEIIVCPPQADLSADTHSDSMRNDSVESECSDCEFEFEIDLANGICGGDGNIINIPDENFLGSEDIFEDDGWDDIPDDFYLTFLNPNVQELRKAIENIEPLDEQTRNLLYRNLYANVISCLEAYLSDTAIKRIQKNPEDKRRFVETSPRFKNEKFNMSQIYQKYEALDKIILIQLRAIIWHKLEVVGHLYKDTFNVGLGDIKPMLQAIAVRHDVVHRNGHDKEGNATVVDKQMVIDLIEDVSNFINNIENQFRLIDLVDIDIVKKDLNMLFNSIGDSKEKIDADSSGIF